MILRQGVLVALLLALILGLWRALPRHDRCLTIGGTLHVGGDCSRRD